MSDQPQADENGPPASRWIMSVMRGNDRRGRWRIGKRSTVVNFIGNTKLDLSEVELEQPVTKINVYSWMGSGEVRVPDGVEVKVAKFALMGHNDVKLGDDVPPAGAPVLRIRLLSMAGGFNVRRVVRRKTGPAAPPRRGR